MSRKDSTIEERPAPQLLYLRRASVLGPAELVVVEEGRQIIWPVSNARLLQLIADASHFLVTRQDK